MDTPITFNNRYNNIEYKRRMEEEHGETSRKEAQRASEAVSGAAFFIKWSRDRAGSTNQQTVAPSRRHEGSRRNTKRDEEEAAMEEDEQRITAEEEEAGEAGEEKEKRR